jgi:hypothetical protein
MVVQQGQGIATSRGHAEVALEVDLPQGVGVFVLEAMPVFAGQAGLGRDEPVAMQDVGHGAGGGNVAHAQVGQSAGDLAPAPGGVCVAQLDDGLLEVVRAARGRVQRPRAARGTCLGDTLLRIALEQRIAGLGADAESPAQLTPIGSVLQGQFHELSLGVHQVSRLPGHRALPRAYRPRKCFLCPRTPVTQVPGPYSEAKESDSPAGARPGQRPTQEAAPEENPNTCLTSDQFHLHIP